jgi:hypothetical protein
MQDGAYVLATLAFFALMAFMVVGCERIVGEPDPEAVPGGLASEADPADELPEAVR